MNNYKTLSTLNLPSEYTILKLGQPLEITSGSEKIRLLEGQVKLDQQVTQIEPA